jgi:hypothetical protein
MGHDLLYAVKYREMRRWTIPWWNGVSRGALEPRIQIAQPNWLSRGYSRLETSFLFLTQNEPSGNPTPWHTHSSLPEDPINERS